MLTRVLELATGTLVSFAVSPEISVWKGAGWVIPVVCHRE